MTTATILAKGNDQNLVADKVSRVIERYDNFAIVYSGDLSN